MSFEGYRRRHLSCGLAVWFGAFLTLSQPVAAESDSACSSVAFEGQAFTACVADPGTDDIRMFFKRPDGTLYGSLSSLPEEGLVFATNAGMFTPEQTPAGLYVEGGREIKSLNTVASGYGNFHIQPNGVFWVKNGKASVTTTAAFAKLGVIPDVATQSGPMLVIDGRINRKFEADGTSRYIRNGVGVDASGRVVVAISNAAVSFGRFARLFKTVLSCPNALYLDGSVSRLRVPGGSDGTGGRLLGPLLGVYRRVP